MIPLCQTLCYPPRDSKTNNDLNGIDYSGREWVKYKEKPPDSDWSSVLECVSCYSLEFSVLLCFNELSLLWG